MLCGPIQALPVLFLFSSLTGQPSGKKNAPAAFFWARIMTFAYRVDRGTDDGNSILDYIAAVADLVVARAASSSMPAMAGG
jgi:hypothetical protein